MLLATQPEVIQQAIEAGWEVDQARRVFDLAVYRWATHYSLAKECEGKCYMDVISVVE